MSLFLREFRPRCDELFLREFHPRCDELSLREFRPRCDELSLREFSIFHFPFSIIIEFFQNEKRTKPQTAR